MFHSDMELNLKMLGIPQCARKTQLSKPFQTPLEICADIRTSGVQNDVCVRHTHYN
jgi:hypothetical protein